MSKYPIRKEFFPFSYFIPPISERFLALALKHMNVPKWIYHDKEVDVCRFEIARKNDEKIEAFLMSCKSASEKSPCLIYFHGGGFVLPAADYHYRNAMLYAKEAGCRVLFVNYRLAPKYPYPVFFEDCYDAFCWAYDNAEMLKIDASLIGLGGDSAGGTLAAGVCMMARDRKHPVKFVFQMLAYPFLDARGNSESCQKYTDTPMWNSTLSKRITPMTKMSKETCDDIYYSPVEADSFAALPPAYIEVAEFDCLHDDGILYAEKLKEAQIDVILNETKGTMHGFDIAQKAPTTKSALDARIGFMKKRFNLGKELR